MLTQVQVSAAYVASCEDELLALKPGNAHVHGDLHKLSVAQFRDSARVSAPSLAQAGAAVGARILAAVEATRAAVGTNTNLGIVLLCAPLAAAAQSLATLDAARLRVALGATLAQLTVWDAELAFRAIALAAPGGLGVAQRHDVHAPARVTLKAAMAEAAGRDRIAFQYAHGFADIFGLGLETAAVAERASIGWREPRWLPLRVCLAFLAAFPDSHIARRHGENVAAELRREAALFCARLDGPGAPAALLPDLRAWDERLNHAGINPGTSADLTVATLFARRLIAAAA